MIRAISHKYWLLFCLAHWGYPSLWATVQPADGSRLSQVHVMFEWDEVPLADGYELAVYQHVTRDGQTQSQKVIHVKTTAIACLATRGLAFGGAYHWRVKAFKKNQLVFESPDYGFDILTCARVMNDSFKTEISHRGKAGKGIVLLDRSAMAIDKAGKPVWFLPMPNDSVDRWLLRDLELTAFGTITYLDAHGAYEKDLMGRLLWRAPDDGKVSGGGQEAYHHEMAKADDGTYLLAGSAYMGNGLDAAQGILYNTIIQYDTLGGVRWYWDERSSLRQDSFFAPKNRYAKGSHLNGFALAKNGQQLYMSFKNLSDVLVYDRAKAGFVSSLKQRADGPSVAFRQQHGPFINKAQEILIYNNNIADDVEGVVHPTVMIFRQDPRNGRHRLVWEYPVRSSRYPEGIRGKEGYVSETADGTLLICPGGVNYALEVDRQKQKRWECYFHRRSGKDTVWQPYSNYRCQSATSLYPFYVTIQCVGIRKGAALFRLQNLGSEPAAFNLLFSGMASPPIRQVLPGRLMPGQAHWVRLPIGFCQKGDFSCTIQPRHGWMPSKTYFYKKME